jgi:hypothetical protein
MPWRLGHSDLSLPPHPKEIANETQLDLEDTSSVADLGDKIPLNQGGNDTGQTSQEVFVCFRSINLAQC